MTGFLVRAISNLGSTTPVSKMFDNLVQLQLRYLEKIGQLASGEFVFCRLEPRNLKS